VSDVPLPDAPPSSPAALPSSPAAPPAEDVRSPLSDGEWHRLHPLSPLLRGGLFLLVVIGLVVANLRERLVEWFLPALLPDGGGEAPPDPVDYVLDHGLLLVAGLVVLGALLVLLGIFWLSWRFHTFRITGDDVEVRSGVLFRTHRRAPLDRVQGVNLVRPLVARLLGLAKLEVVGAGTDGNVKLEYLSTTHADTVRADILRLASGRRLAEARSASADAAAPRGRVQQAAGVVGAGIAGLIDGEDTDVAPESVVRIPPARLAASRVLSGSVLGLAVIVAVVAAGAIWQVPWLLFTFIPALLGFLAYAVRSFVKALRYSIAPTSSGVRVTFGLFTTVTEILPPGRVHALEVRQSLLWRPFGWWTITVNRISGRASSDTSTEQLTTVLPVGTRADVERVLGLLLPDVNDDERRLVLDSGIDVGIGGPRADDPFTTTPRRGRVLRPLSWRRNGIALADDVLVMRRGVVWRTLTVVPLARMQSIGLEQGPLARALRLASLTAHVVAGSATTSLGALDRDDAVAMFARTAEAAVSAAASDRTHRWAR
jgi:putative membrane protein